MLFEFELDNDILGPQIINECDGWKDAKLKLERDKNFHSLIEYFDGSFIFYGNNGVVDGGIDYIKEVEQTQGLDAEIRITIRVSFDGYTFQDLFTGQLNLALAQEVPDNKIQVPIVRDDFWSKFINRLDTPVNIQSQLSLDDVSVDIFDSINLNLSSQKLRTKSEFEQNDFYAYGFDFPTPPAPGSNFEFLAENKAFQINLFDNILDEVEKNNNIPNGPTETVVDTSGLYISGPQINSLYTIEYAGSYLIEILLPLSTKQYITAFGGNPEQKRYLPTFSPGPTPAGVPPDVYIFIQINNEAPISLSRSDLGSAPQQWSEYTYSDTLQLNKGDEIKLYGVPTDNEYSYSYDGSVIITHDLILLGLDNSGILWNSVPPLAFTGDPNPAYIRITADTVFPASNAFSFLIHDAAGQICDRIISENQSFYSQHLGSPNTLYRQYPGDGCGWKYAAIKGLQIRQYSLIEKPFFLSFNQWWKGVNPVLCLGLGYEEVNGSQVVRIEEMDHFYDASGTSLDISNVRQITRVYDQEVIFKTVKVGYSQWQSEDISGIDDPQTKHTYATRFVKTGTELNIESDFIAASLAIETTRRTTKIKSADYKFDNNTFLIAINPNPVVVSPETSPDVNDYSPELDENFTSITNLLNSETRYNSRITPARNLMRWIRYISGCLQSYIDSKFKFVSGEGNYDMESDMSNVSDGCDEIKSELSEKQDIPIYNDPLHLALQYEIRVPLEWEDYLLIRENRKKAIGISQGTTGHVKFFIDTLEYELVKGIATIKAWPVEYFDIQVQEEVPAMRSCIPAVVQTCEDAYLTEDSFEYETEAGECLILE